jgi:hypothetical protein
MSHFGVIVTRWPVASLPFTLICVYALLLSLTLVNNARCPDSVLSDLSDWSTVSDHYNVSFSRPTLSAHLL